jgi:hypothetical protein
MIRRRRLRPRRSASSRAVRDVEKDAEKRDAHSRLVSRGREQELCQRVPLANTPVGGSGREVGRRRYFGLGDRKTVDEQKGKHRRA